MQGPRNAKKNMVEKETISDYGDNLNNDTSFANRSMFVNQTSRIDTSDSTKPSEKQSTFHRKKMSVGESIIMSNKGG